MAQGQRLQDEGMQGSTRANTQKTKHKRTNNSQQGIICYPLLSGDFDECQPQEYYTGYIDSLYLWVDESLWVIAGLVPVLHLDVIDHVLLQQSPQNCFWDDVWLKSIHRCTISTCETHSLLIQIKDLISKSTTALYLQAVNHIHIFPSYILKIYFNIILQFIPAGLNRTFSQRKFYLLVSPHADTCKTHLDTNHRLPPLQIFNNSTLLSHVQISS
jgi:hypothetical protein